MQKLKAAILEDNLSLLKSQKKIIDDSGTVEILFSATDENKFYDEFKLYQNKLDFLILDIDLNGETGLGLTIANDLNKPVIFVSGKTGQYIKDIEALYLDNDIFSHHITKPLTVKKFKKGFDIFKILYEKHLENEQIQLTFKGKEVEKINPMDIVMIQTEPSHTSNTNKIVLFSDNTEKTITKINFTEMKALLKHDYFIQCNKSTLINSAFFKINNIKVKNGSFTFESAPTPQLEIILKKTTISENCKKEVIECLA